MKNRKELKVMITFILIILGYYGISYMWGARTLCFFKNTFGMPCPGCGMTRSTYYLLQGDIVNVLYYNPLIFVVIPLVLLYLLKGKLSFAKKLYENQVLWIIVFLIFITLYIYRMLIFFPHTEPMDFYPDGFVPKAIEFIKSLF